MTELTEHFEIQISVHNRIVVYIEITFKQSTIMSGDAEPFDSPARVGALWVIYISNPLAIIINLVLLLQLLNAYCKKFKSKTNDGSKSKMPYIMVIMYLITSLIPCIGYTFIFTNFNNNITRMRCQIAWIVIYFFSAITITILDMIFLHRIYVIFTDSTYQYKSWIYKSLFVLTIVGPMLGATPIFVAVITRADQVLSTEYDPTTNLTVCSTYNGNALSPTRLTVGVAIILMQTSTLAILLFMFMHGLCSLNRELIKHFGKDHASGNDDELPADTPGTTEIVTTTSNVLDNWSKQRSAARDQSKSAVKRIVILHNLIKKQTIFVCLSTVSTWVYTLTSVIDVMVGIGLGWDVIINAICIWMMLDTSKKYWMLCKNYGVCVCCYWKTNKMGM